MRNLMPLIFQHGKPLLKEVSVLLWSRLDGEAKLPHIFLPACVIAGELN